MELKRCLIIDTETTGVDSKADSVIEIGAVLYSIEHGGTLMEAATLVPMPEKVRNLGERINRISEGLLTDIRDLKIYFKPVFQAMAEAANVFVAHNATFDRDFLTAMDPLLWSAKPWLCTMTDFQFPKADPGEKSLVKIVLAHGLGVASAHRALTDCQSVARVLDSYTPEGRKALFEYALLPRDKYIALTSFDQKELAKARGFQWHPVDKVWWKRMTEAEAMDITEFRIRKVVLSAT